MGKFAPKKHFIGNENERNRREDGFFRLAIGNFGDIINTKYFVKL